MDKRFLIILTGMFLISFVNASPSINFANPTPSDFFYILNNSAEINFTTTGAITNINFTFGNSSGIKNYSFYDKDLLFMVDWDTESVLTQEGKLALYNDNSEGIWHLDETSGANADDDSPNDYDGTLIYSCNFTENGKYGGGVNFTGGADGQSRISIGNQANLAGSDNGFAFGAWVKMTGNSVNGFGVQTLMSDWEQRPLEQVGYIIQCGNAFALGCRTGIGRDGSTIVFTSWSGTGDIFGLDEWHHVAGLFNNSHVSTYIDGVLINVSTYTGTFDAGSNVNLYIGNGYEDRTQVWNGTIDEVFFINARLKHTDMISLYNTQWKERFLATNTGIGYDDAYYAVPGSYLAYGTYNASGDYDFNHEKGAIETWIIPQVEIPSVNQFIFDHLSTPERMLLFISSVDGSLTFGIKNVTDPSYLKYGSTLTPNQPTHVVANWNEQGEAYLYVNGVLVDDSKDLGNNTLTTISTGMFIGVNNAANVNTNGLTIDEMRIYNRTLTDDEVREHYYGNLKYLGIEDGGDKWRFYSEHPLNNDSYYIYQGCSSDGNLNCTEARLISTYPNTCNSPISYGIWKWNWLIDCSDYCVESGTENIYANVTLSGTGNYILKGMWNIINHPYEVFKESTCEFIIESGGSIN